MALENFLKTRETSGRNQRGFFLDSLLKTYGINPSLVPDPEDKQHLVKKYSIELNILRKKIDLLSVKKNADNYITKLLDGNCDGCFLYSELIHLYRGSHVHELITYICSKFQILPAEDSELVDTLFLMAHFSSSTSAYELMRSLYPFHSRSKVNQEEIETSKKELAELEFKLNSPSIEDEEDSISYIDEAFGHRGREKYDRARILEKFLQDAITLEDISDPIESLDDIVDEEHDENNERKDYVLWQPYYLYQVTLNKLIDIIEENKFDIPKDDISKLTRIAENTYNDEALRRIALLSHTKKPGQSFS